MGNLTKSDKVVITIVVMTSAFVLWDITTAFYRHYQNWQSERLYKGTVTEKYITGAGHKVSAKPYIVFYNDSLKRNITVSVSHNTYNSTKNGDWVGFYLTNYDLNQ